ncbi:MAG: prohibitin family protein [Helicobacteraceae bacterium]|jgi:regulator of protease activity HflC (stomatin/prohibitin superfamily)|nr:prohibitin family protein [Helicobacteraceae bacterium]
MDKIAGKLFVSIAAAVIIVGALLSSAYYAVEQGDRAVVLRFGEIQSVSEPGLHFKIPVIDDIRTITVRTVKLSQKLEAYSKDAQAVDIALSINYQIKPSEVGKIYSQYGMSYAESVIIPRVNAIPKDVIGKEAAVNIVQNRGSIAKIIQDDMIAFFDQHGFVVESINIEDISFSDSYEQSVEARMQAEVEVEKVRQNLERERLNAEMVRVKAQGAADANVAQAKAEAEAKILIGKAEAETKVIIGKAEATAIEAKAAALAKNPSLVKLIEAERWNGELPATMIPNSAIPIISGASGK